VLQIPDQNALAVLQEQRSADFRQDMSRASLACQHALGTLQGAGDLLGRATSCSAHIALKKTDADRFACGCSPRNELERTGAEPSQASSGRRGAAAGFLQPAAIAWTSRPEDATVRQATPYTPSIGRCQPSGLFRRLRITDREPGKAGEDPATHPFREYPGAESHDSTHPGQADADCGEYRTGGTGREKRRKQRDAAGDPVPAWRRNRAG